MTTSKIPPPRKLTESEDIDSFDDWWFQAVLYYGRDDNFKEFFENQDFSWQTKATENRGLANALKAANLTCLLRALATYAIGPYIKTNITEKAKSLDDVRNEFLKFLEIEVNDFTAMHWFNIQRKPTERPLVFYYRLRYHMTKHLVKKSIVVNGTALPKDEDISPSLDRMVVMEWLYRLDNRLIKFVQEKFSTELSAGTNVLNTMVETLAKNVDHYITRLNVSDSASVGAVSLDPSFYPENDSSHDDSVAVVGYQQSYNRGGGGYRGGGFRGNRNFPRRGYQNQRGFQPRGRGAPRTNPNMCEYCYIQSKTRSVDFRHPIARCPEMTAMHGAVNLVDYEYGDDQELYEDSAREFFAEQD